MNQPRRILIAGATGLVGVRLGLALARERHEIRVLSRSRSATLPLPFPHKSFSWDPAVGTIDQKCLDGVDTIINLAGTSIADHRWTPEMKKSILDSRVQSTELLLKAASQLLHPPELMINASAVGIYGSHLGTHESSAAPKGGDSDPIFEEDGPLGDDFLAQVCREWEKALFSSASPIRRVALRLGVVLSESGGALAKMLPLFQSGVGGPVGSGLQWMSWIHIDDLVSIFIHVMKNRELEGAINAVAPSPVQNRDFSKTLARVLDCSAFVPAPSLALKAALGEMSQIVTHGQRVIPAKIKKSGFEFQFPHLEAALNQLVGDLRGGSRLYLSEQFVPRPLPEVFKFFSSEKNLERLTPEFLNFHVLGKSTPEIEKGTLIDYRLKIHGLPARWQSRIIEWEPNRYFVDEQVRGPYKVWKHLHRFEEFGSGTLISDRVIYKLPAGRLGSLVGGGVVKNDVRRIFQYRQKVIEELWGK